MCGVNQAKIPILKSELSWQQIKITWEGSNIKETRKEFGLCEFVFLINPFGQTEKGFTVSKTMCPTLHSFFTVKPFIGDHKVSRYGGRGPDVLLQRWPAAAASEGPSGFRPRCWGRSGGRGAGRTASGEESTKTRTYFWFLQSCNNICFFLSSSVFKANRNHELHVRCWWHGLHGVSEPRQQSSSWKQERASSI